MVFEEEDKKILEKIGVKNLLELCLQVPNGYQNTDFITSLQHNSIGTLEVRILEHIQVKNMLKIFAFLPTFQQDITLIVFHPKPFHRKLFAKNTSIFIYGKLQNQYGFLSILQPRVIKEPNAINLKFKTSSLGNALLQTLCEKYITQENLNALKIPQQYIQALYEIFHPSKTFLETFEKNNGFSKSALQALKFIEIFHYISSLSKKRRYFPAKFRCDTPYEDFIKSLPFTLTKSQQNTILTIAKDLRSNKAAKRIIMGDVGCGKTIVILASAIITYPYQSLLMVPTTILAMQIYEEAKRLLPNFMRIECIFRTTKQKTSSLFEDNVHFIIGTQALLHRKINAKNLALVMTDEQHRFGTNQRHYLEKMAQEDSSKKPHFLQFSATPIPRTLSMINANLIDFSFMRDLPFKKDIDTQIIEKKDFTTLFLHLKKEIAQQHQCVIVYPLVEESQHLDYLSLAEGIPFWQKHFQNVFVTFGSDKNKEEILEQFRDKGDILLATTLIEVGISLPRLSTIVIIAPENMGLATLHQLRGRVSRNGLKGYCFLYTNAAISQRLIEFCKHLSGFDIAEIDLKYRSGGDLLQGERQSGASFRFFDLGCDNAILLQAQHCLNQNH